MPVAYIDLSERLGNHVNVSRSSSDLFTYKHTLSSDRTLDMEHAEQQPGWAGGGDGECEGVGTAQVQQELGGGGGGEEEEEEEDQDSMVLSSSSSDDDEGGDDDAYDGGAGDAGGVVRLVHDEDIGFYIRCVIDWVGD
jgi:hypothetical protein